LVSRRRVFQAVLGWLGTYAPARWRPALAASEHAVPSTLPAEKLDFSKASLDAWTTVEGRWVVEDMPDAPSGSKALVQRAAKNQFNAATAFDDLTIREVKKGDSP
jgi:hypothetical protein